MNREEHILTPDAANQAAPEPTLKEGKSPAGMVRRMAALSYDILIVTAILMAATVPFLPFVDGKVLMTQEVGALAYAYRIWELAVIAVFFGVFWTRRGQTLGMQAWRLRVEDQTGRLLGWRLSLLRQVYACVPWLPAFILLSYADSTRQKSVQLVGEALLILGILAWAMMGFDPQRRTWHDRVTGTRVVLLPKSGLSNAEW